MNCKDFTSGNGNGTSKCNQGDAKCAARAEQHHNSFDFLVVRLRMPQSWSRERESVHETRADFLRTRAGPGDRTGCGNRGGPRTVFYSLRLRQRMRQQDDRTELAGETFSQGQLA